MKIYHPLYRYLNWRTLGLFLVYLCLCSASYVCAYLLRFDFSIPEHYVADLSATLWWVVALKLMLLFCLGQFDSILSYFRLPDLMRLFAALFASSVVLISMWYVYSGDGVPPRSVVLTDLLLSFLLIAGFRVVLRIKSSQSLEDWFSGDDFERVLIVGAGEVGAGLCSELLHKGRFKMRPVAFIDDDRAKVGRYVHGVLVAGAVEDLGTVAKRYDASKVIIAFPSASVVRMRMVTKIAKDAGLAVDTVPALKDIVKGRASMTQLRPVQMEDLLGRDPIDLNGEGIRAMIIGKRVVVTGAGGSIGSELVAQILSYEPASLLCLDQAEMAVFNLQQSILDAEAGGTPVESRVTDVSDSGTMEAVFKDFDPEVLFHAAAHKHVNLMENHPGEALRNNFMATRQLAELSSRHGLERFILISTDKAINPTSVMGASKRLAELAIQSQQTATGNTTRFMAVRFGNVLGSSGSVIPIFRRQIEKGGPVTVTDPEVTRYFMTVEEAVGLVLQSASLGKGGEIFVLDMGEPVKILDMARQMIALSGFTEGDNIEIRFSGLRPGEKLYEEVQHISESLVATAHPRVLCMVSGGLNGFDLEAALEHLSACIEAGDTSMTKSAIHRFVPEYTPCLDV